MNLKVHTDYALRTLLYLAHKGGQASVEEIAVAYGISKDHLFKVVQQLVRLGYIASKPGRTGGVWLRVPAEQIRVDRVVGEFEGRNGVLACVAEPTVCVLEPGCVLRHALIDAENAFYDTLSKLTIAGAIRPSSSPSSTAGRQSGGVYNLTLRRGPSEGPPAGRPAAAPLAPAPGALPAAATERNAD